MDDGWYLILTTLVGSKVFNEARGLWDFIKFLP